MSTSQEKILFPCSNTGNKVFPEPLLGDKHPKRGYQKRKKDTLTCDETTLSVKSLLSTSKRDFLVRSNGDKVHITELEGKVVGLYFYSSYYSDYHVNKLKELYEQLWMNGKPFEIVFIPRSKSKMVKMSFLKKFKGVPWLSLPFSDKKGRKKVYRILSSKSYALWPYRNIDDDMVIIKPGDNFAHTNAMDIIRHYGIEAYPFTREGVTEMEIRSLKSLKLDSILFSGIYRHVFDREGKEIPASYFVGKKIILYMTCECVIKDWPSGFFPRSLCERFDEIKEAFEIIRISRDYDLTLRDDELPFDDIKWFDFPYDPFYNEPLFAKSLKVVSNCELPILVAFGPDGKFINRKTVDDFISSQGDASVIFNEDDSEFFPEFHEQIARNKVWAIRDEDGDEYIPL